MPAEHASEQVERPGWGAPAAIDLVLSRRGGGVSPPPWDALNLGLSCGDDAARVSRNRQVFAAAAGMPMAPIFLQQVHGARVVDWSDQVVHPADPPVPADAQVTTRPGQPLAILMADCLPVVLTDTTGSIVAAAHAGWRGVRAGVLANVVRHVRSRVGANNGLLAWIGPGIGPCCFAVGAEVRAAFCTQDPGAAAAFCAPRAGTHAAAQGAAWVADLAALASRQLRRLDVLVTIDGRCTMCDPQAFFSYRRDGTTGRMAVAIWRKYA
ncbi:MAG: peptidoglycan editing factor PgeF [Oceanococcaceae bacterium]